jgi:hypothetical protein
VIRATVSRYGYWTAVGVLSVAIAVMGFLIVVNIAIPEIRSSGVFAAKGPLNPSAEPTTTPRPTTDISMGGAVIPANAQCAGCHLDGTGSIGLDAIPVMAHPLEGWGKCTNCHAPDKLVETAPGHTGIHASECTVCHKPGDLPAPLSRPHRENENVACLSCHGTPTAPLPPDMTHRKEATCWLCHRLPTIEPPVPAHETAPGEADCRTCHVAGGNAGKLPTDHVDRPANLCLSCHEVTLGAAPGSTPRIMIWPAPSMTPAP